MAFVASLGSSLATDCSMRRRGSPFRSSYLEGWPRQPDEPGLVQETHDPLGATFGQVHQSVASEASLFSRVLGIRGSDPPLGSLPTYPHPRKRRPDGLSRDAPFGKAFFEADLGGQVQRPQACVFSVVPGRVVQKLPQGLDPLRTLEGPVNGVRTFGALTKRLRETLLVEGVDGVAGGLRVASQLVGDPVGILAPRAGEQDLATA